MKKKLFKGLALCSNFIFLVRASPLHLLLLRATSHSRQKLFLFQFSNFISVWLQLSTWKEISFGFFGCTSVGFEWPANSKPSNSMHQQRQGREWKEQGGKLQIVWGHAFQLTNTIARYQSKTPRGTIFNTEIQVT